jgi:hypothetical protein
MCLRGMTGQVTSRMEASLVITGPPQELPRATGYEHCVARRIRDGLLQLTPPTFQQRFLAAAEQGEPLVLVHQLPPPLVEGEKLRQRKG